MRDPFSPPIQSFPLRKWYGWGSPQEAADLPADSSAWKFLAETLGVREDAGLPVPPLDSFEKAPSRLPENVKEALQRLLGNRLVIEWEDRLQHGLGKSYRDLVRLRLKDLPPLPDAVVYPQSHEEVREIVEHANVHQIQVIPFGGGSSVVGGVEVRPRSDGDVAISLDLCGLDRILEVDQEARLIKVQGGVYGPALEDALAEHGLMLGHYPQSFEFSTVGGWVATRGAGQQSTKYGKIEDMVRGVRVVTPSGEIETPVFPASATGPNLNEMFVGSEGLYGVITEATLTVRPLPETRDFRGFTFPSWSAGKEALRELLQRDIVPAVARLSDPTETASFLRLSTAKLTFFEHLARDLGMTLINTIGAHLADGCLMLIGFEGEQAHVDSEFAAARRILKSRGGFPLGSGPGRKWLSERYRLPYLRDLLFDRGVLIDTLETSTTWSNLDHLYDVTRNALESSIRGSGAEPLVLCHISHLYPDGASLYFTFMCRIEGQPLEQWEGIKKAATAAIVGGKGSLSHHHAIGYEHQPWMGDQFGHGIEAMKAVKDRLDPKRILNPGKVV